MYPEDPTREPAHRDGAHTASASVPATIGRYEVLRLLGRGGMGEVYLARDPVLDRQVAVKLISGGVDSAKSKEQLVREARAAGRLRHPNIVTIFDSGEHDGRPFIAMEYVRGETFGNLIHRQAPIALARRLELVEGACAGLAHAHQAGVVHLDIKPDNLMLDESGIVKVLDFGIARVLQSGLLVTRQLGGTLRYMSPEQIDGKPLDHRSDVFSLGCALFELITFVPAFVGSTKDIVTQISSGPVPALRAAVPELDERLDAIVRKAMALDPAQRYATLAQLGADLAAVRTRMNPEYDPRVRVVPAVDVRSDELPTIPSSTMSGGNTAVSSPSPRASEPRRRSLIAAIVVAALVTTVMLWTLRPSSGTPTGSRDESLADSAISSSVPPAANVPGAPAPVASRDLKGDASARSSDAAAVSPRVPNEPQSKVAETASPTVNAPARTESSNTVVPPVPEVSPPTSAETAPANAPPAAALSTEPGAAVPTPIAEPPRVAIRTDQDAVRDTLRRYEAAYRALDVTGILEVYPSLARDQADQLRRTFATVTQYDVDIRSPQIDVQADTATVRATLTRRITPRVGNPVANEVATEFRLRRAGSSWSIVAVAAR
jgi:serine/threonine-protein kinase